MHEEQLLQRQLQESPLNVHSGRNHPDDSMHTSLTKSISAS